MKSKIKHNHTADFTKVDKKKHYDVVLPQGTITFTPVCLACIKTKGA